MLINTADDYLRKRLQEWAYWFRQHQYEKLGYPDRTMEKRFADYGGVLVKSNVRQYMPCNTAAEEIEGLVCKMHKEQPKLAATLREEYFGKGSTRVKAMRLKLKRVQFEINVSMACQWLLSYLRKK